MDESIVTVVEWGAEQFCYLTTTGRKTGRPHTIEIWFAEDAGRLFLLAGGRERADWVRNLRHRPSVGLRVGSAPPGVVAPSPSARGQIHSYDGPATATIVTDPADDERARELLAAKYQGWSPGTPMSRWARTALAVVVVPQPLPGRGAGLFGEPLTP